jgi:multiple sugar transport system ATP-binding protein
MAGLSLSGVTKSFEGVDVLRGIDLAIDDGEFCVFVGPSGCGKSTLLRVIAGLEEVTDGTVSIGGRVVNALSPKERGIAMVFQSYALYPHRTVRGNMEFGLKLSRLPRTEIEERVMRAARMLRIEELLDRRPAQLSGGQRQRVAIGRAIVRDPTVFLFDEPLSNLDAKLRVSMREEIKDLHGRLGATMVYVTHDQIEAMTLADRIVILNDGRIEQVGSPVEVFDMPANVFVAQFIGSPSMNLFHATATEQGFAFPSGYRVDRPETLRVAPGRKVRLGLRPEDLALGATGLPGEVALVENTGADLHLVVTTEGQRANVSLRGRPAVSAGDKVGLGFDPARLHVFDAATGLRIDGRADAS